MAKELVNKSHRLMKDEESRWIAAVEAFPLAKKRIQELNNQLTKADRERKSVDTALHVAEKQVETQCKQLCLTEDLLSIAKEQIRTMKTKLEEAEKVVEKVVQDGYDVGVAKTEEALRAEVSRMCKTYCLQVWNEALNQVGFEASFALKRVENVYHPPTIEHQALQAPKLKLPPRRWILARTALPRPSLLPIVLLKR